ncbi:hypothetical protein D2962_06210 [Biomaibacter acetigenes]|uniref:Uncharacterized protein n=2 Tax=Biomaibacter acetigenes TaxID=2316383 RepID=A0A3G2R4J0_9FIRM|nr:hypothetical protein D2962_06210 [Biomaibacter acetigenes]
MQLGRKIYYEKTNGIVIWDKGEMSGDVQETTLEQDKESMPVLKLITPEQLGVLQLSYGEYAEEFASCRGYRINPDTGRLQFIQ